MLGLIIQVLCLSLGFWPLLEKLQYHMDVHSLVLHSGVHDRSHCSATMFIYLLSCCKKEGIWKLSDISVYNLVFTEVKTNIIISRILVYMVLMFQQLGCVLFLDNSQNVGGYGIVIHQPQFWNCCCLFNKTYWITFVSVALKEWVSVSLQEKSNQLHECHWIVFAIFISIYILCFSNFASKLTSRCFNF